MTTDLPAGRELDALVAEMVMGLVRRREPDSTGWSSTGGVDCWFDNAGAFLFHVPPHYSTDIAAAWVLVETVPSNSVRMEQDDEMAMADKEWHCEFLRGGACDNHRPWRTIGEAYGETLPEAICRAALKAVGHG